METLGSDRKPRVRVRSGWYVLQWQRTREDKMRADEVVVARSYRASRDASLSTGYGVAAIQEVPLWPFISGSLRSRWR